MSFVTSSPPKSVHLPAGTPLVNRPNIQTKKETSMSLLKKLSFVALGTFAVLGAASACKNEFEVKPTGSSGSLSLNNVPSNPLLSKSDCVFNIGPELKDKIEAARFIETRCSSSLENSNIFKERLGLYADDSDNSNLVEKVIELYGADDMDLSIETAKERPEGAHRDYALHKIFDYAILMKDLDQAKEINDLISNTSLRDKLHNKIMDDYVVQIIESKEIKLLEKIIKFETLPEWGNIAFESEYIKLLQILKMKGQSKFSAQVVRAIESQSPIYKKSPILSQVIKRI